MSRNLRPDPNRKSFWQFQDVSKDPFQQSPHGSTRMVAVFRHATENNGVVTPSTGIVYPNVRTYTLAELNEIKNAPLHPKAPKAADPKKAAEESEKNRMMINLARAGLTRSEFERALNALSIKSAPTETVAAIQTPKDSLTLDAA